jgi:heme-degrading monooxygenase HmoA
MIVVQNRVPVTAGHEDAFIERFRARRGLVDDQPGFIRNMVLSPIKGDYFIVLTFWESEEHFRAMRSRKHTAVCRRGRCSGGVRSWRFTRWISIR